MARQEVRAELTGIVWQVSTKVGEIVSADDTLLVIESMKMEIPIAAPTGGKVVEIKVDEGDVVEEGMLVAIIEF